MTKRQNKICQLLVLFGRKAILQDFKPDSCIASTKVAVKVLSHFKIPVRPQTVTLEIMNPIYRERFDSLGGHPSKATGQEWLDAGAWEIVMECQGQDLGHLIAIVNNELLIDLSLDQASRPHKNIHLGPQAYYIPRGWNHHKMLIYEKDGCRFVYHPVDSEIFRKSRDWSIGSRTTRVSKAIIRRIERGL